MNAQTGQHKKWEIENAKRQRVYVLSNHIISWKGTGKHRFTYRGITASPHRTRTFINPLRTQLIFCLARWARKSDLSCRWTDQGHFPSYLHDYTYRKWIVLSVHAWQKYVHKRTVVYNRRLSGIFSYIFTVTLIWPIRGKVKLINAGKFPRDGLARTYTIYHYIVAGQYNARAPGRPSQIREMRGRARDGEIFIVARVCARVYYYPTRIVRMTYIIWAGVGFNFGTDFEQLITRARGGRRDADGRASRSAARRIEEDAVPARPGRRNTVRLGQKSNYRRTKLKLWSLFQYDKNHMNYIYINV